jgi:SagB-type dehydrogenase family enzyme
MQADESLLYDPVLYEAHKKKQLFRPPAVGADGAIPLSAGVDHLPAAMVQRRSLRRFSSAPIDWESFSRALSAFRHVRDGSGVRALYPSTGGLYGLDVYVHVKSGRVARLPGGVYYYHPAAHALHPAGTEAGIGKDMHHHQNRPIFAGSAFTLIFVFASETTTPVYGTSSQFLASIETGIALATFIQIAEIVGLGVCPIGLFDFDGVGKALSLKPGHNVLHVAECGKKPDQDADDAGHVKPAANLSVAELRQFLASALPDYMVPSQFVLIDEIPLTPNNKVDRDALLKMESSAHLELGTEFAAAESEFEARLLAVWSRVLRLEQIGVDDNFFDLGGDSMGVAEVHGHILNQWKLDVPIVKLFQYPTIRTAARFLRDLTCGAEPSAQPAGQECHAPAPARSDLDPVSEFDRQAAEWVHAHPDDPRAAAVASKLRSRHVPV